MCLWLFNVYMDEVMKGVKMGMRKSEIYGGRERLEIPDLLWADDLVLLGESEEDLRAMMGRIIEV